jgi:hypothetical protein
MLKAKDRATIILNPKQMDSQNLASFIYVLPVIEDNEITQLNPCLVVSDVISMQDFESVTLKSGLNYCFLPR